MWCYVAGSDRKEIVEIESGTTIGVVTEGERSMIRANYSTYIWFKDLAIYPSVSKAHQRFRVLCTYVFMAVDLQE